MLSVDAKGDIQVQVGIMKLNVKLSDLRMAKSERKDTVKQKITLEKQPIGLTLDIRGMLVDEALIEVDRYLENAAMYGLNEVSIIHGKGTGELRTGVQNYLRIHRLVDSFWQGAYGEGDAGVTAVVLKK